MKPLTTIPYLQLYLCSSHVLLAADRHGLLVLLPGKPLLNLLLVAFVCVCAAHEMRAASDLLVAYIVPSLSPQEASASPHAAAAEGALTQQRSSRVRTLCGTFLVGVVLLFVLVAPLAYRNGAFRI